MCRSLPKLKWIVAALLTVALSTGCTAPDVVLPSVDVSVDDDVITNPYTVDDIQSVDMIGTTTVDAQSDAPVMCLAWHVQLMQVDPDSKAPGAAWHSSGQCIDGDSDPMIEPSAVQIPLSENQLGAFRAAIDKTGLTTWNAWLDENDVIDDTPADGTMIFSIAVLVDNQYGMYYDTLSVTTVFPPGWQAFVDEMSRVAGDPRKDK